MVDDDRRVCKAGAPAACPLHTDRVVRCGMSSRFELRTIDRGERDAVLDLLAGWLAARLLRPLLRPRPDLPRRPLLRRREDGRIVSTLQVFRKTVRVDGATLAGRRRRQRLYRSRPTAPAGLASALLERAIAAMRQQVSICPCSSPAGSTSTAASAGGASSAICRSSNRADRRHRPRSRPTRSIPARDLAGVHGGVRGCTAAPIAGATVRDAPTGPASCAMPATRTNASSSRARRRAASPMRARTTLYDFNAVIEHGCVPGAEAALAELHLRAARGARDRYARPARAVGCTSRSCSPRAGSACAWSKTAPAMWRVIDAGASRRQVAPARGGGAPQTTSSTSSSRRSAAATGSPTVSSDASVV